MIKVLNYGTAGMNISISGLAGKLHLDYKKLEEVYELMYANGDIQWGSDGTKELSIVSTDKTIAAFLEKKYLNQPWEKFKKGVDFWIKFTAIISLGLSIFTTTITCNKSQDDKREILLLQQQINELKDKANLLPQSKILPSLSPLKDSLHK